MRKQKQTSIVTHPSLSLPIDMYRGRQDSIIPFYDKFLWLYEICKSIWPEESYLLECFRKQLIARTQLIIRYFPIELPSVGT